MIMDRETREEIGNIKRDIGELQRKLAILTSRVGPPDNSVVTDLERQVIALKNQVGNLGLKPGWSSPTETLEDLIFQIIPRIKQDLGIKQDLAPVPSGTSADTGRIVEEVLNRVRQDRQVVAIPPGGSNTGGEDLRRIIAALTKDMESSEVLEAVLQDVDNETIANALAALVKDQFMRDHGQEMPGLVAVALVDGTEETSAFELSEEDTERIAEAVAMKIVANPTGFIDKDALTEQIAEKYYENVNDSDITDKVADGIIDHLEVTLKRERGRD